MPGVRVTLKAPKPKAIPNPQTIGEHIKARRLALSLYQRQAAEVLGVDPFTVLNWETNKTQPPASAYPAILAFLGYDPLPKPEGIAARLKAKRRELGWTIREAAANLDADPTAWAAWERGGLILRHEHRRGVASLLRVPLEEIEGRAPDGVCYRLSRMQKWPRYLARGKRLGLRKTLKDRFG